MTQQHIVIDVCPRDNQSPLLRTADQICTEKMAGLHLSTARRNCEIILSGADCFLTRCLVRLRARPTPKAKRPTNGRRR